MCYVVLVEMREILTVNIGNLSNEAIAQFFNKQLDQTTSESYEKSILFQESSKKSLLPRLVSINFPSSSLSSNEATLSERDKEVIETGIQAVSSNKIQFVSQSFKNDNFDFRKTYRQEIASRSIVNLSSLTFKDAQKKQYCSLSDINLDLTLDSIRYEMEKCDKLEQLFFSYDSFNYFSGFSSRLLFKINDQLLTSNKIISTPISSETSQDKATKLLFDLNESISLFCNEDLSRLSIPLKIKKKDDLNIISSVYDTIVAPFTATENTEESRLSLSSFFPYNSRKFVNCNYFDYTKSESSSTRTSYDDARIPLFTVNEKIKKRTAPISMENSIEHEVLIKKGDVSVNRFSYDSSFEITVESREESKAVQLFQNEAVTGKLIYDGYLKLKSNKSMFKHTFGEEEEDREDIIEKGKTLLEAYNLREIEDSDGDEGW